MPHRAKHSLLPRYHGKKWIRDGLPSKIGPWLPAQKRSYVRHRSDRRVIGKVLHEAVSHSPWKWPKRPVYFFADPHADAEAFNASLVASGGIHKTGPGIYDIALTAAGRKAEFIIGGDCLDKGPSNLQLLRAIRNLMETGARVILLGGNHDVRLLIGIRAMELDRDPRTEHLFVRMGPKVVPLLKEIHDEYLNHKHALRGIPGKRECRRRLYPSASWFREFPIVAAWLMPKKAIEREIRRMRLKVEGFEDACAEAGLSLRQVYATAQKCRALFFDREGEFAWFFHDMQLAHRAGSFLFIHAGLDDRVAALINEKGVGHINRLFRKQIKHDPFEFYYGPVANTMRTKYRDVDMPLTRHGIEHVYRRGIHVIVHGHRNRTAGQRIMLRSGMIHIEGDITMDRNSRRKEGLKNYGAGVTIIEPGGHVLGISTDHPCAKLFEPEALIKLHMKKSHATQ